MSARAATHSNITKAVPLVTEKQAPDASAPPPPRKEGTGFKNYLHWLHELNDKSQKILSKDLSNSNALQTQFADLHIQMAEELYKLLKNPPQTPNWTQPQISALAQTENNTTRLNLELMLLNQPSIQRALAQIEQQQMRPNPNQPGQNATNLQLYLNQLQSNNPQQYQQLLALAPALAMARELKNKAEGPTNSWDIDLDRSMTTKEQNIVRCLTEMHENEVKEEDKQAQAEAAAVNPQDAAETPSKDEDEDEDEDKDKYETKKQQQVQKLLAQQMIESRGLQEESQEVQEDQTEELQADKKSHKNQPSWLERTLEKKWRLLDTIVKTAEKEKPGNSPSSGANGPTLRR